MSHFTLLVIGNDIEGQLEPFNEHTEMDKYVSQTKEQIIAEGKESIERYKNGNYAEYLKDPEAYKESCGDNDNHFKYVSKDFPKRLNMTDEELYQDEIKYELEDEAENDAPGSLIGPNGEKYSTYNPQSKWDWYEIGGRWTGFFKLRRGGKGEVGRPGLMTSSPPNGWADSALKKDIDFEGMFDKVADEAGERYEKVHKAIEGMEHETWDSVRDRMLIAEARTFYHDQPRIKAFLKVIDYFGADIEEYLVPKNDYVGMCGRDSISTYAVLKDGEWYEKGTMGWWAISTDEDDNWSEKFYELLGELPDDTLLTLVDCHI